MIVVGVDGSESSRNALAWALREARLRDDALCVVCAWDITYLAYGAMGYVPPIGPDTLALLEQAAADTIARMLEGEQSAARGVTVKRSTVRGPAADVLVEAAKDADLLVVGSRGHGEAVGLLLGSVSFRCAHLSPCPVVIVRHHADASDG